MNALIDWAPFLGPGAGGNLGSQVSQGDCLVSQDLTPSLLEIWIRILVSPAFWCFVTPGSGFLPQKSELCRLSFVTKGNFDFILSLKSVIHHPKPSQSLPRTAVPIHPPRVDACLHLGMPTGLPSSPPHPLPPASCPPALGSSFGFSAAETCPEGNTGMHFQELPLPQRGKRRS